MLAKKTSKNQLTLPKEVVKEFPNTEYFDVSVEDRKIVLIPVRIVPADMSFEGVKHRMERLGVTEDDVVDAAKLIRKRGREGRSRD